MSTTALRPRSRCLRWGSCQHRFRPGDRTILSKVSKPWVHAKKRLHRNVIAITLANELTRIAWSVLARGQAFRAKFGVTPAAVASTFFIVDCYGLCEC